MAKLTRPLVEASAENGWRARLELGFVEQLGRTVMARRSHVGPLRVQKPFYPEGRVCHVYLVHPPGGIVGGDRVEVQVAVEAGAHALLTTPAAGKFYRSAGATQHQRIELSLRPGACLEWLPQATIYYPGAAVRQCTLVHLQHTAAFAGWDIACFGLPASGGAFLRGRVAQSLEIWLGNRPLLLDRLHFDGAGAEMHSAWGLAGFNAIGSFAAYPATRADVDELRTLTSNDHAGLRIACSLVDGVVLCRCLAAHADVVTRSFTEIWQHLRPRLMGRVAVAPRIWST